MTKSELEAIESNIYLMDVVPKIIQSIEKEVSPSADMTELSDQIKSIRNSVQFENEEDKYYATISYSQINITASRIARKYDIQKRDIANILLSPFFPKTEFTENDLTLLKTLEDEFNKAPFSPSRMREATMSCFKIKKEMDTSYAHLLERGIITVEGN